MAERPPGPNDGVPPPIAAVDGAWQILAELLGTTATAALMRRAAKRAQACLRDPATLATFTVEGAGYSYCFKAPAAWDSSEASAAAEVRALLGELCALLSELTGDVVTSRLATAPAVRPFLPPDCDQRNPHAIRF